MAETTKLNLYQKINLIQTELYEIKKTGYNKFSKYAYKTFTDIKNAFNKLLREYKVVFLPTNINMQSTADLLLETNGGSKSTVKYIQEFVLLDADSEKSHSFFFPMLGTHPEGIDKANGSATTYGLKYLFNLWGLIPDEEMDPDNDINSGRMEALKKPEIKEPPKAKGVELTPKAIYEAIEYLGKKEHEDFKLLFGKEYKLITLDQFKQEQLKVKQFLEAHKDKIKNIIANMGDK